MTTLRDFEPPAWATADDLNDPRKVVAMKFHRAAGPTFGAIMESDIFNYLTPDQVDALGKLGHLDGALIICEDANIVPKSQALQQFVREILDGCERLRNATHVAMATKLVATNASPTMQVDPSPVEANTN